VSAAIPQPARTNSYPTTDGRPMAETDRHRKLMIELQLALERWFRDQPDVYVSGNLLLFYEEGNKRRHISPDVFVVFGIPNHERDNYLLWEEGRGPNVVVEFTSSSTRREDTHRKFELYRDVLRVPEYFLFDPFGDYLTPRFQGYRLAANQYRPIRLQEGRMRSKQLGLLLEPDGIHLHLVDPQTGRRVPTPIEAESTAEERARAAADQVRAEAEARRAAEEEARAAAERARSAESEIERLRAELAALRKRPGGRNGHGARNA
jgi:Uma2 family endonuclease